MSEEKNEMPQADILDRLSAIDGREYGPAHPMRRLCDDAADPRITHWFQKATHWQPLPEPPSEGEK